MNSHRSRRFIALCVCGSALAACDRSPTAATFNSDDDVDASIVDVPVSEAPISELLTRCNDGGTDPATDPRNCGRCGVVCPTPPGGDASCSAGACGFTCVVGRHPCGNACVLDDSSAQCGAMCQRCEYSGDHGQPACDARSGTCVVRCDEGYARNRAGDCEPIGAPRLISPMNGSVVPRAPTLRIAPAPGSTGSRIFIASDPSFSRDVQVISTTVSTATLPEPLAAGHVYYWRAEAQSDGATSRPSPTWVMNTALAERGALFQSAPHVSDADGDGRDELVVAGSDEQVTIFSQPYRSEARRLSPPSGLGGSFGRSLWPLQDLTGDGRSEIGVASQDGVYLHLGGPDALRSSATQTVCTSPLALSALLDVNVDGYVDAVCFMPGTPNNRLQFWQGGHAAGLIEDGSLELTEIDASEPIAAIAAVGDVDGDGRDALAIVGSSHVWILEASPAGLAAHPEQVLTLEGPLAAVVPLGDTNDDGYGDLAVRRGTPATVALHFGGPTGLNGRPSLTLSGAGAALLGAMDLNHDGRADLAVGDGEHNRVTVYFGDPSGLSAARSLTLAGPDGGGFGRALSALDEDGDGVVDLAVGAPSAYRDGRVYIYRGVRSAGMPLNLGRVISAPAGVTGFGAVMP